MLYARATRCSAWVRWGPWGAAIRGRRFGKTSLIRAVLRQAKSDGLIAIEVNFLGCVTVADVAERIERAYVSQLRGPLRRWFDAMLRTFRPTVALAPGGVGVSAEVQARGTGLLDLLALPRQVHARTGQVCLIAFDEFQEVLRIDDALPGVFRSELETHGQTAGYIFSGSHPGLMRSLFSDRRHAFFAQAAPIHIGPLPPVELAEHITARFADHRRDPGEALGPLLDLCEGHPQRAMLLAHHLFERTPAGRTATVEHWADAVATAQREAAGEIQVLWSACTSLERKVLKLVAAVTVPLQSKEAASRFGISKGGSVQAALDRLAQDGHVVPDERTRSGFRITDPFLAAWLRDDPLLVS